MGGWGGKSRTEREFDFIIRPATGPCCLVRPGPVGVGVISFSLFEQGHDERGRAAGRSEADTLTFCRYRRIGICLASRDLCVLLRLFFIFFLELGNGVRLPPFI